MSDRKNKQAQFAQPQKKNNLIAVAVAALVAVALGLLAWKVLGGGETGKFAKVSASQGQILISASDVSDGKAHFFTYKSGATNVNFFVIKSSDGQIRAALDTCDVCFKGRMGYRQEGENMLCIKCGQKFHSNLINVLRGGCNPVPLQRAVLDGKVVIPEVELIEGAAFFQTNPS